MFGLYQPGETTTNKSFLFGVCRYRLLQIVHDPRFIGIERIMIRIQKLLVLFS